MNKPLILVVEDDTAVRNLITTTLKAHDYRYLTAVNGESAVLEASSHNPDVILLDLGLPDIDGVEVIRRVRSWSNLPIIVISARSEDRDKCLRCFITVHFGHREDSDEAFYVFLYPQNKLIHFSYLKEQCLSL